MRIAVSGEDTWTYNALRFHYHYRNRVVGGTSGALSAAADAPQAVLTDASRRAINALVNIGGTYLRMLYKFPKVDAGDVELGLTEVICEAVNYGMGQPTHNALFKDATPLTYLLDNFMDDKKYNRFVVNNAVRRNPIDVALMFLTTMDNEFGIFDADAGSTSTVVQVAGGGLTASQWIGYALHCVEGANLGEARVISANATGTLTVDRAFSGAAAAGDQHQIRNTIYDVLPLSWGMGQHNADIDVTTFEDARDKYLGAAELGRWAVGDGDEQDLWGFVRDYICAPYGVLLYTARANGKLSARYVGESVVQDGLDEAYVAVAAKDIIEIGDMVLEPRAPLTEISLKVRSAQVIAIRPNLTPSRKRVPYMEDVVAAPGVDSDLVTIPIRAKNLDLALRHDDSSVVVMSPFNSVLDAGFCAAILAGRLLRETTPAPECRLVLDASFFPKIDSGTKLSITDTTQHNPVNPLTGVRGWSSMVARVLSTQYSPGDTKLVCNVQLLGAITGGRIAPAARVSAKGEDGNGHYFVVNFTSADFAIDLGTRDWRLFVVGDLIELRSKLGVLKEASEEIKAFGSNQSSTPAGASDGRIYIIGTIATPTIATDDYVTFAPWVSNALTTANMELHTAYADAAETLGSDNQAARQYT